MILDCLCLIQDDSQERELMQDSLFLLIVFRPPLVLEMLSVGFMEFVSKELTFSFAVVRPVGASGLG